MAQLTGPLFDEVLVPLDASPGADRIVPTAVALAGRLGARLTLWGVAHGADEVPALETQVTALLRREAAGRGEVHVTAEDDPAGAIVAFAADRPGTLIAVATHGRGRIGEAALGSVSVEVLRRATGPVLVAGPHHDGGGRPATVLRRVAVCIDGSGSAEAVVGPTAALARAAGLDLTVLRAVATEAPARDLADARADVEQLATTLGPRASGELVAADHPADALVGWCEHTEGCVLVLATPPGTDRGADGLGSLAASVVRRAACPVLVVPAPVPALV